MSDQGLRDFFDRFEERESARERRDEQLVTLLREVTAERQAPAKGISWRTVAAVVSAVVGSLLLAGAVAAQVLETDEEARVAHEMLAEKQSTGDAAVVDEVTKAMRTLRTVVHDIHTRVSVLEDRDTRPRTRRAAAPNDEE